MPRIYDSSATQRMVGRVYGDLEVLRLDGRIQFPGGQTQLAVLVRCKCGREYQAMSAHVRYGRALQCDECRKKASSARGRSKLSVRLPNGLTIAQLAFVHGLDSNTVYRRWLRGWPLERLGDPLVRGPKPRHGGSADLPERRGTMYGRRAS